MNLKNMVTRRFFLKKATNIAIGAYVFISLTMYSPKASATLDIQDEVVKYIAKYFGMDWINDMKAGFDKINKMVEDMYGVIGGGKGGEDDSNIKKIVGISKANDATNTIGETVFNIEVATETQPSAVDACVISGNKKKLAGLEASAKAEAERKSKVSTYTPEPMAQARKIADAGYRASKEVKRSSEEPQAFSASTLAEETGEYLPPWLNVNTFLTNSGYSITVSPNQLYSKDADEFLGHFLSDSGLIPDADYVLKMSRNSADPRVTTLVEDITHIVNARATVEMVLEKIKQSRIRKQEIFNVYANGEKEYVVDIAKNHSIKIGSDNYMSIIDSFNADVERFAQSPEFIKDYIKSDGPTAAPSNSKDKKVIDELAVGHTPLLITAATIINAQQKWQLDVIEQNEMISKLEALIGLYDQVVMNSELGNPLNYASNSIDPLFNYATGSIKTEMLS
jgi:hypothetical protein